MKYNDWKKKLSKRGGFYFSFILSWLKQVKSYISSDKFSWKDVPGYSLILKSFLLEMKQRNVFTYPDSLVEASLELLRNDKLITVFSPIIFNNFLEYDNKCC